jgi:hypothetical protein
MRPPRLATWLLRHFGCGPHNESVLGDLAEQYRDRRSRLWYWKQVVLAIALSVFSEVWNHKLLAFRALILGWTIKAIWLWAYFEVFGTAVHRLSRMHEATAVSVAMILETIVGALLVFALVTTGWIIARTHHRHSRAMVLLFLAVEVIAVPLTFGYIAVVPTFFWIFPVLEVTNAIQYHFGIFNSIAALWTSGVVMVLSVLTGAGFFRHTPSDSSEQKLVIG